MIELMAVAPLIAVFLVVLVQVAALFHNALGNMAQARAEATRVVRAHELNAQAGERVCLPKRTIAIDGSAVPLGFGAWRHEVNVPQEVHIVADDICGD